MALLGVQFIDVIFFAGQGRIPPRRDFLLRRTARAAQQETDG